MAKGSGWSRNAGTERCAGLIIGHGSAGTLGGVEATERFVELMSAPEAEVRPDEVALLISAHLRPQLDVADEMAALDRLAEGCPTPDLQGVRTRLFSDLGFRGDDENYHRPDNSYLDAAIRRRRGLPITLSVLTIGVARRVGVPLVGVGMPGHFLVGDAVDRDVYVDPFGGGSLLDAAGCERLFHALQGPRAAFHPSYLQPVGPRAIAARMLANLKAVFAASGDQGSLVSVLRLRTTVPGVPSSEHAELASALAALGAFGAAADEMELVAQASAGRAAEEPAAAARRLRARLN